MERRELKQWKTAFFLFECLLMLIFTIMGALAADYRTGLIHEWQFTEQAGTSAADSVGVNNLVVTNAAIWEPWFLDGTGIHTGTAGYATQNASWATGNAWTIILTYQANQTLNGDIMRLRPASGTPADGSEIRLASSSTDSRKFVYTAVSGAGNAAGYKQFLGTTNYVNNTKITIGIVWDGTALWGYYNGTKDGLTVLNNGSLSMNNTLRELGIGGWTTNRNNMLGSHARIYSQALTEAQMQDVTDYLFGLSATPTLTVGATNTVNGSAIEGVCASFTNSTTTATNCTTSGTSVSQQFPQYDIVNISIFSIGVGDQTRSGIYFNITALENYEIPFTQTITNETFQAWLNVNATQLYTNNPILEFNATNNQATNTTTTGTTLVKANTGTNNVMASVAGNYTANTTCTAVSLTTTTCTLQGVYDNQYTITAVERITNNTVNNYNVTATNTSLGTTTNTTTTGTLVLQLLQGYNYDFEITSAGYATEEITLNVNSSNHTYEFELYTENSINITFLDEQTGNILNTTTITADFIGSFETRTNTTSTGYMYIDLLIPDTYTIQYGATGYITRNYQVTITDSSFQELTLYLLDSTNGTTVTINVQDSLEAPVEGATVKIQRLNLTSGNYETVEIRQTNFEGQTKASMVLDTVFYKFIIEVDGEVLLTTQETQIYGTTLTLTIDLTSGSGFEEIFTYYTMSGNVTYLTDTNRFRFNYNDESNTATSACLTIYNLTEQRIQSAQSCSASASGTIYINIDNSTGNTYQAIGTITASDGITYTLDNLVKSFGDFIPESGSGLFMMFLMILVFTFALAINVEIAVIVASMIPMLFSAMELSSLGFEYTIPIFALGLVLAFIMGVVRK